MEANTNLAGILRLVGVVSSPELSHLPFQVVKNLNALRVSARTFRELKDCDPFKDPSHSVGQREHLIQRVNGHHQNLYEQLGESIALSVDDNQARINDLHKESEALLRFFGNRYGQLGVSVHEETRGDPVVPDDAPAAMHGGVAVTNACRCAEPF